MAFLLSFHVLELIIFTFKAADIFVGSGRGPETELPHGKKMVRFEIGLREVTLDSLTVQLRHYTRVCTHTHSHAHTHIFTCSPMLCRH